MSERLQTILLVCLTMLGLTALVGMIVLEMSDKPILGNLSSIATGVLVALTSLVVILGQLARGNRMEAAQAQHGQQLAKTEATVEQIAHQTNGHQTAMLARIASLEAELLTRPPRAAVSSENALQRSSP